MHKASTATSRIGTWGWSKPVQRLLNNAGGLEEKLERIRHWRAESFYSYSYFNNDTLWNGRPAAIDNAKRLREQVEVESVVDR